MTTTHPSPTSGYSESLLPKVSLVAATTIHPEFRDAHPEDIGHLGGDDLPIYKGIPVPDDRSDAITNVGQAVVEFGGRACYQSFHNPSGRTNEQYIKNILNQNHYSVLEHGTASFYIENIDRALTHELIRHRHLSPSELSQRYVDRVEAQIVVPPLYRSDPILMEEYLKIMEDQLNHYGYLVELTEKRQPGLHRKQVREAARRVLGEGVETKILLTGNYRAWREMLSKRFSVHADASILELAEILLQKLKTIAPAVFSDLELQTN